MQRIKLICLFGLCVTLAACGGGSGSDSVSSSSTNAASDANANNGAQATRADIDRHCDNAAFPSPEWTQCEAENFAKLLEAPAESLNPAFAAALLAQSTRALQTYVQRLVDDPSYLPVASPALNSLLQGLSDPASLTDRLTGILGQTLSNPTGAIQLPLNTPLLTQCSLQGGPCVGDPFRYPQVDGPDGRTFYENEAQVEQITFYDRECARLAGHLWRPRNASGRLPGVVFEVGSVGVPETIYWWLPQLLVRNGYAVMTFEVRGQGRSDFATPAGAFGTNVVPSVFWTNFVDAVDFFRSSPDNPYPNEQTCAGTYPTETAAFNPQYESVDLQRLGIAGHSLGGIGVTAVQGYGATGADPWPGQLDTRNPVDVAVAFDGLIDPQGARVGGALGPAQVYLPQIVDPAAALLVKRDFPNVAPRVPTMGQSSDYGLAPAPYVLPPDPEFRKDAYQKWKAASVPIYEFTIQGSSHLEWSQIPPFYATSFCPHPESGECEGGYGLPMAEYYTLAWFDRWLKQPGEPGFGTADARLLDDGGPQGAVKMSFRFRSARDFADRAGLSHHCEDIRAGCSQ